jgi:hypothetical protein
MVPISHPELRPEVGTMVAKYAQRHVDVIDLAENALATVLFRDLMDGIDASDLYLLISELKDGGIYDPISRSLRRDPGQVHILTFNNLLRRTDFVALMDRILTILEDAYGRPVDVEFTASIGPQREVRINLLQCRPMTIAGVVDAVEVPDAIDPARLLFRSTRCMGGGVAEYLRYLVYIDPESYARIADVETKRAMRGVVGRINARLRERGEPMILLGPGRFGSSNINLGVNVRYADIDNAVVLVEMGRDAGDHAPEVSYGTHFFQDLVEARVLYLAVFPGASGDEQAFNADFFERAPNCLPDLVPDAASFAPLIKVIDVARVGDGQTVSVVADPRSQRAVCFLTH